VGRRVGVVDVVVELPRERADEGGVRVLLGAVVREFVRDEAHVLQEDGLSLVQVPDRADRALAVGVVDVPDLLARVLGEDVGVLFEGEMIVVARTALVGQEREAVTLSEHSLDGVGVALEALVVLHLAVLDGGVEIQAREDGTRFFDVRQRPIGRHQAM